MIPWYTFVIFIHALAACCCLPYNTVHTGVHNYTCTHTHRCKINRLFLCVQSIISVIIHVSEQYAQIKKWKVRFNHLLSSFTHGFIKCSLTEWLECVLHMWYEYVSYVNFHMSCTVCVTSPYLILDLVLGLRWIEIFLYQLNDYCAIFKTYFLKLPWFTKKQMLISSSKTPFSTNATVHKVFFQISGSADLWNVYIILLVSGFITWRLFNMILWNMHVRFIKHVEEYIVVV